VASEPNQDQPGSKRGLENHQIVFLRQFMPVDAHHAHHGEAHEGEKFENALVLDSEWVRSGNFGFIR
jgi:hypothetical protein